LHTICFVELKKIGLLSDTHSYLHPRVFEFFREVDEVWHAGDIGDIGTYNKLAAFRPLRAVYGNIDGREIRMVCPGSLSFSVEGVKVLMTHIGGYPGRYDPRARAQIEHEQPLLFVCGHSHILRIMFDKLHGLLYVNPGAAGKSGMHRSLTMVRFTVEGDQMKNMEVLDLPRDSSETD
jgi:uncharacterized protein